MFCVITLIKLVGGTYWKMTKTIYTYSFIIAWWLYVHDVIHLFTNVFSKWVYFVLNHGIFFLPGLIILTTCHCLHISPAARSLSTKHRIDRLIRSIYKTCRYSLEWSPPARHYTYGYNFIHIFRLSGIVVASYTYTYFTYII